MKTIKVVLTQPFVRHPAGLVFELNEATGISGWDDDDRVRDRQNFSGKQSYHLPDGGNGMACELPVYMTEVCPPEVFEQEDLRSGPCRLTGANKLEAKTIVPDSILKYAVTLAAMDGLDAQGLQLPVDQWENLPKTVRLYDRLRAEQVQVLSWSDMPAGLVDCRALPPGFFSLDIEISGVFLYQIQFIKSFPLLVQMSPNGRYTTQKTLY